MVLRDLVRLLWFRVQIGSEFLPEFVPESKPKMHQFFFIFYFFFCQLWPPRNCVNRRHWELRDHSHSRGERGFTVLKCSGKVCLSPVNTFLWMLTLRLIDVVCGRSVSSRYISWHQGLPTCSDLFTSPNIFVVFSEGHHFQYVVCPVHSCQNVQQGPLALLHCSLQEDHPVRDQSDNGTAGAVHKFRGHQKSGCTGGNGTPPLFGGFLFLHCPHSSCGKLAGRFSHFLLLYLPPHSCYQVSCAG